MFREPSNSRRTTQTCIARNINRLPLTTKQLTANLRSVTDSAQQDPNAKEGAGWYVNYSTYLSDLSSETNYSAAQIICAFAALSPMTHIDRNAQLLNDLLETGDCSHQSGDAIDKARRCLDTPHPYEILRGHKVKSFASNLLRPYTPGPVTIDRHVYSILLSRPTSDKERNVLARVGVYQYLAGIYRHIAGEQGMMPHELQAMTWTYYRQQLNDQDPTHNIEEF